MSTLMEKAKQAYDKSYSPYSRIRVGACVLGKSGKMYSGCNVENASYGATICAERCAVLKAISEGEEEIMEIAVTADIDDYAYPCGMCRQFLSEFMHPKAIVRVAGNHREEKTFTLEELIPNAFTFNRKR